MLYDFITTPRGNVLSYKLKTSSVILTVYCRLRSCYTKTYEKVHVSLIWAYCLDVSVNTKPPILLSVLMFLFPSLLLSLNRAQMDYQCLDAGRR